VRVRNIELEGGSALIQVYTGNGKGKTTAAFGLALRAAGAGLKVYIGQFVKGRHYHELNAIKKIRNITLEQFGRKCFIKKRPGKKDIACARRGLERIKEIIAGKKYRVLILDEINIALYFQLIPVNELLSVLKKIPQKTECILTGRYAPVKVLHAADLVSDIKAVKHYFQRGIKARRGIEF
jgi:cob(I)alamin adenosyltransferase